MNQAWLKKRRVALSLVLKVNRVLLNERGVVTEMGEWSTAVASARGVCLFHGQLM